MIRYNIAVLGGDGIGPDVIKESLRVLQAVAAGLNDVSFAFDEISVGAAEYLRTGDPLPASAIDRMQACDAILLGAMGLPQVRWPNGVEMTPQIDIREKLDLFNGIRPLKLYHENHTPLKGYGGDGRTIDFVLIRENCEGLFSARLAPRGGDRTRETDTLLVTRRGAERIFRAAFELARTRRRHVTLVDKANVLPSLAFFRRVFDEVALDFPDVTTERVYIDAMALFLLQRPHVYDVIVTENMFGDILSDLGAGLVGGMGMAPSADIGEEWALFQPAHGSAPDIAGKGVANPVATILSVALMLEWLGDAESVRGARMIERAVTDVLSNPANATRDLGGNLSSTEMTTRIIAALRVDGTAKTSRATENNAAGISLSNLG